MNPVFTGQKLTYQEYAEIPDDGLRHEIIDGVHFMNPALSTYHQTVLGEIFHQLYVAIQTAGLGRLFLAPVDVLLSEFDIVQPDLAVILAENDIITPANIQGSPDLVVEILSPSTRDSDRVLKRERYQTAGVPEYWIVDPQEQTLDQLVLTDGKYVSREHENVVVLSILPDVSVNLDEVW